jgi:hypothetical protein
VSQHEGKQRVLMICYILTEFVGKGSIKDALTRTGSDEF